MKPSSTCESLDAPLGSLEWRTLLPVCLRKARQSTHADPAAGELLLQFTASSRAIRDGFMRIFGPAGFSDHKFIVLVVLLAQDPTPSTPSELAEHASITRASMTSVLDDLEQRRWIERHRDPENRRTIRVTLTSRGRRAIGEATALYLEIAADLVRAISPTDLAAFARVCDFLQNAGRAMPGDLPRFPARAETP
jgi:DNA-binding MarR family transcriptional regulator